MIRLICTLLLCGSTAFAQDQSPGDVPTAEQAVAFRKMGRMLMREGDHARALTYWTKIVRRKDATATDYFAQARCHEQLLQFIDSARACDRALLKRTGWREAKTLRDKMRATAQKLRIARQVGENLFKEGKFKASLSRWETVIGILKDNDVAWFYKAACHANLRELPKVDVFTEEERPRTLKRLSICTEHEVRDRQPEGRALREVPLRWARFFGGDDRNFPDASEWEDLVAQAKEMRKWVDREHRPRRAVVHDHRSGLGGALSSRARWIDLLRFSRDEREGHELDRLHSADR